MNTDTESTIRKNGFIHLHRSILGWSYHKNPLLLSVWMHLIMLAEYEEREQDGIVIHRGELMVSQLWLAQFIGISRQQLRNCLSILESTNEITKRKTGNVTMLKIVKYDEYQRLSTNMPKPSNHDDNHALNQQDNHKERNINNNKKNLSDGEIQKSTPQGSKEEDRVETPPAPLRTAYAKQLAAHEGWKQKCCRDRHIAPGQIDRCIIAFHEYLLRNNPGKAWLSFDDFCLHFHSWLRYQKPEDIANLLAQAMQRSRQQKAKAIEQQRQQQMWQDIEAAKQNAVSYEEYKRSHSNSES